MTDATPTETIDLTTASAGQTAGERGAAMRVAGRGKGKGLKFERFFTTAGTHPYDEVEWDLRDAVITNWRDGTTSFEQRGVEFPAEWSMNATTIVAQKYFRGTMGTPERERSVKHMIDRVADNITSWGVDGGYFADEDTAEVFKAELKHLLVNQKAAFNSPVWFNVGASGDKKPQCSACQPWDALVSTPSGFIPIGEIVDKNLVGLEVLDAHGTTRVVATKNNGTKRAYRVQLANGMFVEATGDHVVQAVERRREEPQWVRVDDLHKGMRMHLQPHRRNAWMAVPDDREVAEAALAGWLQADGFVGQYDHGTNQSLTMEFMAANHEEEGWIKQHLDVVFPDVHRKVMDHPTIPNYKKIRLYGEVLRPYVEKWGLLDRRLDIRVPSQLWTASGEVVAAYLRSLFQADGYVTADGKRVGFAVISEKWTEDIQLLLLRLGIYSRRRCKVEPRENREDMWEIDIAIRSERERFADLVGFVDGMKSDRLDASIAVDGKNCPDLREERIVDIIDLGEMPVYDIQTESGEYLSNSIVVHNCFILSVEDTMSSILNWYVEEGKIFQGGSGAGLNLSAIRSSKEHLKGGGEASGPVSFMRGADASAGTIKSGGKTRRAAKMVILNVDHPDIEEFIATKVNEEEKIRVLRDAGFDMDLDGADYASVQYQNANNSVRVTDEFMEAYEAGTDYAVKAVTTGETLEMKSAQGVMRRFAEATWTCADPGMQYDSTINDWHTTPESGRINGSNPCSEYMHLDNSACNLASLNLKKFYNYEDGFFDVAAYQRAIEIIFTAQEIIVGYSSYPTEPIGRNAIAYRQLGIGYANLGGLLMSLGLPYDSDEGRAWGGALTAVLTGHAYRTSAEIAKVVGPFEGYAQNAKPMQRVIGKHRDALADIDPRPVPADLLEAAKQDWDDAFELGEKHGFRNAQASVLAPTGTIGLMMDCDTTGIEPDLGLVKMKKMVGGGSMQIVNQTVPAALEALGYSNEISEAIIAYIDEHKTIKDAPGLKAEHVKVFQCAMGDDAIHYMGHVAMMAAAQPFISGAISKCVVGDTLLATEDGLVRIESLHQGEDADTFRDHVIGVASLDGIQKTDAFYYGGVKPVREVVLRSGQRITGTHNHRLLVADDAGFDWKRLDQIETGDHVAQQLGAELWSPLPARFDGFEASEPYGSQKTVTIPAEMTEDLAFLLGAYASEGHTARSVWTVKIHNADEGMLARTAAAIESTFGISAKIIHPEDRCPSVEFSSKTVVEFFEFLGTGSHARNKRIPDAVLRSPRVMVLAFLEGLWADAYTAMMGSTPKWALCLESNELLDSLQSVLSNLGIVHSRITKHNAEYDKDFDEVYASGQAAQALIRLVPFPEAYKRVRAEALLELTPSQSTADIVPIAPRELYDYLPRGKSGRNGHGCRTEFAFLCDDRTKNVSRRTLERVAAVPGIELPDWLLRVLADGLHFTPVVSVEDAGEREVYDVSVPTTKAFVGNGIVNHNTVNLPEDATVEDVEQLHVDAWKMGIKAIAIYRDNCKVAQPLSVAKKGDAEAAAAAAAPAPAAGMVRRKLPKQRPSQTISFSVGDAKGYVTAGEYPGDGLGELFVKLGKQGSTLSGLLDAFAISVSLGLQYGVPLEAYVSKFMNMRFEPAGMTDDSEIRFATSIVDYIARKLAIEYLPYDQRSGLGIFTTEERTAALEAEAQAVEASVPSAPTAEAVQAASPAPRLEGGSVPVDHDAPMCYACGIKMKRAGSCHVCESCGTTSGCS